MPQPTIQNQTIEESSIRELSVFFVSFVPLWFYLPSFFNEIRLLCRHT